jgi:hypothetical protein
MCSLELDVLKTPEVNAGGTVRLTAAAPALWRVVDRSGRVIGHLQAISEDAGVRYRARRFHAAARALIDLGDFWSAADAIDCLRFAR